MRTFTAAGCWRQIMVTSMSLNTVIFVAIIESVFVRLIILTVFTEILNARLYYANNDTFTCNKCDLSVQMYPVYEPLDDFIVSYPHIDYAYTILIAPGEPYTDLERMFMMFDFETWVAIALTLTAAILATLGLNFVSEKFCIFIAGQESQSPTMNLASIFLTGGQARAPRKSFARFIFILFVFWSLIIRTCYQSLFFELLQADLRKSTIKTLDDLFESNITLYEVERSLIFGEYFEERMQMPSTRFVKTSNF